MKTVLTQNNFPLFYESLIQYAWKSIPALPDFLNETNCFLPPFRINPARNKKRLPEKGNRDVYKRQELTEQEEKQIEELDGEPLFDLIQSLDAIHTPEDFQRQIHEKANQNVQIKQAVLHR